MEFYATSAQVIPVLLLALFVVGPKPNQSVAPAPLSIVRAFRILVLGLLYVSEGFALAALAYGRNGSTGLILLAEILALALLCNEAYEYVRPGPWRRPRRPFEEKSKRAGPVDHEEVD